MGALSNVVRLRPELADAAIDGFSIGIDVPLRFEQKCLRRLELLPAHRAHDRTFPCAVVAIASPSATGFV